jgi:hypothetical protein
MTANASVLERLIAEAIRVGATALDVEYKDGYDEVCVLHGPIGFGIARFRSSSSEAIALGEELVSIPKRGCQLSIAGHAWDLRCRVRDSFGEAAYRVEIRRAESSSAVKPRVRSGSEKHVERRARSPRARRR